jgi:arginyl-tRNA--protein-N-Asp/Glu arginylyltransferase
VVADDFTPSSTQKRNLRRNDDIVVTECRPWATSEQFELLQLYLNKRHPGGGMAAMDEIDYADMVEHTAVSSFLLEYREPSSPDGGPGRLIGACLTDRQGDGLSMIYSFYDPEHEARTGLGNFIILDHIRRAKAAGLRYVYLGYWVDGAQRMQYKIRYRPLERLGPAGWRRVSDAEHDALISRVSNTPREDVATVEGGSKDGTPGGQQQYKLA